MHFMIQAEINFCIVCHEMDPMAIAYNDDIHSNKGKNGILEG